MILIIDDDRSVTASLALLLKQAGYASHAVGTPAQAIIIDAVDATLVTTADFANTRRADIPDLWFQRDYLPHVKAE